MNEENINADETRISTPLTRRKVKNPFDKALINRLHTPICSPGMCKIYKKKCDGTFVWDIEQACCLVPTEIVACNSQFEPSPDPFLEKIAEEATERFFSQTTVIPSPLESSKKSKRLLLKKSIDSVLVTKIEKITTSKSVSVQTMLSFPVDLPPEIENILKNYHIVPKDVDMSLDDDDDDEMTMNRSRRKLFEEHCVSDDTDDEMVIEKPTPLQNYEVHAPVTFSPDLSHDWVIKENIRTFGTPLKKDELDGLHGKGLRKKLLDVIDFNEACLSPIKGAALPADCDTPSSLASTSFSPII